MRPNSLPRVRSVFASTLTLALAFSSFALPELRAQDVSPAQKDLIQKALEHLKKDDYVGGRPLFEQLIKEFTGKPAFASYLDDLYFYVARSYYEELKKKPDDKNLGSQAIDKFKEYESKYADGKNIHYSLMSRVDVYLILNNRKEALEVLDLVLGPKYNSTIPSENLRQEAKYKFTRLCYELEDWNRGIPQFKKMLAEYAADRENRSLMAMYMSVGYMRQAIKEAEAANKDKPVITPDKVNKLMEVITPVIPLIELDSLARNDLYFNGVLFNAAELLYRSNSIIEASYYYYQTQTPQSLQDYMQKVLAERRKDFATLINTQPNSPRKGEFEEKVKEVEFRLKEITDLIQKNDYTPYLRFRKADCLRLLNRHFEAHFAFFDLSKDYKNKSVKDINPEDLWWLAFELAGKAPMIKRAINLGEDYLTAKDWTKQKYDQEVMLKLIDIYEAQGNVSKVLVLADKYIKKYPSKPYAKLMIFKIGQNLIKSVEYDRLKSQTNNYLETLKDQPGFDKLKDGLLYWRGISQVLLQDFDGALPDFSAVVNEYGASDKGKASDYWEDAQFREAICHYGLQEMKEAEAKLLKFLETFPNSTNRGEAHLYLGDLYSGKNKNDDAVKNYHLAVDFTVKNGGAQTFIDHSTFQIGQIQEKSRKFEDMQKTYEDYIEKFQNTPAADITTAIFNLGRAFEGQNRPDKMMSTYYDAIVKFGDNPRTFGLDHILLSINERFFENKGMIEDNLSFLKSMLETPEERKKFFADGPAGDTARYDIIKKYAHLDGAFQKSCRQEAFRKNCRDSDAFLQDQFGNYELIAKQMPTQPPIDKFGELYKEAKSKDKRTLGLRLMMAADKAVNKALDTFTFTDADLAVASPATLVWISQKTNDKKMATDALNYVLEKYRESDFGFEAYLQLGAQAEKIGDLTKAQLYYKGAGDSYPSHEQSFLSYIREGDIMTKMSKFDEAKKLYEEVLRNPAWKRNEAAIEAKYKLGKLFVAQSKYKDAAAAFNRIYIAHPTSHWAALAYLEAGSSYGMQGDSSNEQKVYEEFLKNQVARSKNPEVEAEIMKRIKK